jgi:alkylated DNA repair dioxygenase AlkB
MSAILSQMSLFNDDKKAAISGLHYFPDYIDAKTEEFLLKKIDNEYWLSDLKRRVQHYGYKYDYKARRITPDLQIGSIPDWLAGLCSELCSKKIFAKIPNQVIINEYQAGQGITPHIDCMPCFGETIASISVYTPCVMEFTHIETGEKFSQLLEPRSLLTFSGEARYKWQHAIPQRKTDIIDGQKITRGRRISLTFRTVILQ